MPWEEFRQMLIGIGPDTALGRIVAIRAEKDKSILDKFSPEQRRIRNEWLLRSAKAKNPEQTGDFLEQMKQAFIQLAGGGKN